MNEPVIRICRYEEISPLKFLTKESVDMKNNGKTIYIGYFENGCIIGVAGYQLIGSKIRYKTDGVSPEHRGKGVYQKLFAYRDSLCSKLYSYSTTAFCTKMSVGTYLRNGFKIKSIKNGVSFVERLSNEQL